MWCGRFGAMLQRWDKARRSRLYPLDLLASPINLDSIGVWCILSRVGLAIGSFARNRDAVLFTCTL
jgi:hypothetical protein